MWPVSYNTTKKNEILQDIYQIINILAQIFFRKLDPCLS